MSVVQASSIVTIICLLDVVRSKIYPFRVYDNTSVERGSAVRL